MTVPKRDFIIGRAGLQTRRLSPNTLPEPLHDESAVRLSPPGRVTGSSIHPDTRKPSGHVSPLRSLTRDSRLKKSPYMRRSPRINTPPIDLAEQSTLVNSFVPHDGLEQPKQDGISVPSPQIPLAPTPAATVSPRQDCPRIDLVALVREKRKTKKPQKKKLSVLPLLKEQPRRMVPRDLSSEGFR